MQTETYRILDVRVSKSATDRNRYEWRVLESDGKLIEASTLTYATDQDAMRAGNAAARKIRHLGSR
jgi:hypothetical protein